MERAHSPRNRGAAASEMVAPVLAPGRELRSNTLFDTDAQRRAFASLRSSPPVAGQLQR